MVQFEEAREPAKKKRVGHASIRTEKLGDDPRLNRSIIRDSLPPGFYVCFSGNRKIPTLHKLGLCHALPVVDYVHYDFAGQTLPPVTAYDTVCKLCARKYILNADISGESVTSSSTEDEASPHNSTRIVMCPLFGQRLTTSLVLFCEQVILFVKGYCH